MKNGETWWDAVKATVTPLGGPKTRVRARPMAQARHSLDLHGMTVHDAYMAVMEFFASTQHRKVQIITGKSGQIRQEFVRWIENDRRVSRIIPKSGGGSYEIHFARPKTIPKPKQG